MKRFTFLIIGLLSLCFFSICSSADQSFETRRDFAVRFNKERLASSKNEIRVKWVKDILAALALTDAKNINNPKVASAVLSNRKNGTYRLLVFWLENHPSVDGVELCFNDQVPPISIPIPETQLKLIRNEAKDTIVFGSEYDWKNDSETWKDLEQITNAKNLKIRLLRAKAPATDWFPIDLYKSGKWISRTSQR